MAETKYPEYVLPETDALGNDYLVHQHQDRILAKHLDFPFSFKGKDYDSGYVCIPAHPKKPFAMDDAEFSETYEAVNSPSPVL